MSKAVVRLTVLALLLIVPPSALATPETTLWRIESGSFTETGGFAGSVTHELPEPGLAFIQLEVGLDFPYGPGSAILSALTADLTPSLWSIGRELWIYGEYLNGQFIGPAPYYPGEPVRARRHEDTLRIDGTHMPSPPQCCDIPYAFEFTDVVATPVPEPSTSLLVLTALVSLSAIRARTFIRLNRPGIAGGSGVLV